MQNNSNRSKKIAKNTMVLFVRLIVTTIVSLFTARLTLQLLGAEDFGIYNVVAGVIGFMSILTNTMTSATQRFLSFDLGKNDIEEFKKTFSILVVIYFFICLVSLIVFELIGPWFISNYLVIPSDRLDIAQIVFQCVIFDFLLTAIITPYLSAIVAYELMGVFAYFTIFDVISKLVVVYMLYITPADRLLTIGVLTMVVDVLRNVILFLYCRKKVPGCKFSYYMEYGRFISIIKYAFWNIFGSMTWILNNQGQSVILNMFFGPTVNTAKAIADKINGVVTSLSKNFFMAVSPQIVKSYSGGDINYMRSLIIYSTKYSFFLMAAVSFPIILCIKELLIVWLGEKEVSYSMICFSKLVLIYVLINVLSEPITHAVRATGNIRKYQIVIGAITLLFLPLCVIVFKMGMPSYYSMILLNLIYIVAHFARILLVKKIVKIRVWDYLNKIVAPIMFTTLFYFFVVWMLDDILIKNGNTVLSLMNLFIYSLLYLCVCFLIGINHTERKILSKYFFKYYHKYTAHV